MKDEQVSEVISCLQLLFLILPFQNLVEANDQLAIDIEGHGNIEEEQVEEIGKLQNHIKILLRKKSLLCAKINALEHTIERDNLLLEESSKTTEDLETLKDEISRLNLQNQALLNEQKMTNDKNEEDMKKLEMELKDESERVRQLNIQNKMVMAENQWLKISLKQSQDEYLEDMEKMMKDLEKEKIRNMASWKLW